MKKQTVQSQSAPARTRLPAARSSSINLPGSTVPCPAILRPPPSTLARWVSALLLLTALLSPAFSSNAGAGEGTNLPVSTVTGVTGTVARTIAAVTNSLAAAAAETPEAGRGLLTASPSVPASAQPFFRAGELTVDLFACYTVPEPNGLAGLFKTDATHGKFGAGLAATYWLTRNLGAGLEATVPALDDLKGALFQQATLYAAARLPLGHFAPYALAGVGREFDSSQWNTQVGLGAEWRFRPAVGLFTDARYVFAAHETDSLVIRAGLRLAF